MLSIVKPFKKLSKRNGYGFVNESFALNLYIFMALTNIKLLLPYADLNKIISLIL